MQFERPKLVMYPPQSCPIMTYYLPLLLYILSIAIYGGGPPYSLFAHGHLQEPLNGTQEVWTGYRCKYTHSRGIIECETSSGITKQYKNSEDVVEDAGSPTWWLDLSVVVCLVLGAGMMSGLTIGLMGLDITTLDILSRSGEPKQRVYAKRILPLLKRHHLLLVTLLLMNALAMESLPIFLERLVSPLLAVIVSVTLILMFGEIVPQALCSKYGLAIGGNLSYVVWFLIIICFIVAWPISKILDHLIGTEHGTFFKRTELKHLIDLHGKKNAKGNSDERLSPDEIRVIKGALDLKTKKVFDVMTPLNEVNMLNVEKCINQKRLQKIIDCGHSRMPVYQNSRDNIVGMLLVKNLIVLDSDDVPISSLELTQLQKVSQKTSLYDMLNIFQQGTHMAIVVDVDNLTTVGIVTLESIIEELIQKEIRDETDTAVKNKSKSPAVEVNLAAAGTGGTTNPSTHHENDQKEREEIIASASEFSDDTEMSGESARERKNRSPISKPRKREKGLRAKNLKDKLAKVLKVEGEKETKAPLLDEEYPMETLGAEADEGLLVNSDKLKKSNNKRKKSDKEESNDMFTELSLDEDTTTVKDDNTLL